MRKLLVLENATDVTVNTFADHVNSMKENDTYVCNIMPVIIDIDDGMVLTKDLVLDFCKQFNIQVMQ